jgi:hypothetical protein
LLFLVNHSKMFGSKHIAISTNGTADLELYKNLIRVGANDFSISLDGACCAVGDIMSGGRTGAWETVVNNIRELSKLTYVSVGMVFTELNVDQCKEAVLFADSLGVSDIRVIPSAQYNQALYSLGDLPDSILNKYKILNYRINNIRNCVPIRGLNPNDNHLCPLVLDDVMIAKNYHYPCPIYFRENGLPIGKVNSELRSERKSWFETHDCYEDSICGQNCLDVCRQFNNRWKELHERRDF